MGFFWFLVIGAVVGWLAGQRMKEGPFSITGDLIVGVVGGLIGGFVSRNFGLTGAAGVIGGGLLSAAGAFAMVYALRLYGKKTVRVAAGSRDRNGRRR